MEDKKYIKQMQKQIVDLKKYIVFLENKVELLIHFTKRNENNE